MIVTVDGRRLESDYTPGCTLEALLDRIRNEHVDDRLVISVAVNGHTFSDGDLETGLATTLAPDDQVDLETGDRGAVAAGALRSVAEALAEVGELQTEIVNQLNGGQAAEAIRQIGESMQVWQACRNTVAQCGGLVGRDLTAEESDGRSVADYLGDLAERLRELRDAFQAHDMVLLADLVHYEMPGLCETWHDLLMSLADGIEGHGGAPRTGSARM